MQLIYRLLSAGVRYFVFDDAIEIVGAEELFNSHVHTVAPIVTRDGRHVDLLFGRILAAQVSVNRHPILPRKDGKHCRRIHMLVKDDVANPRLGEVGGLSRTSEHRVVEMLRLFRILFPPCANAAHIVCRRCAY